jgi:thioredoxin
MVTELDAATFAETTGAGDVVVVDFWAPWCRPCTAFAPVFEAAAAEHTSVRFAKLNVEDHPQVATEMEVRSIPTLMVFAGGERVADRVGAISAAALDELVASVSAETG